MRWMVTLGFANFTPEMAALVPAEQAHVRELMTQGSLETINIAADGSKVWMVIPGDNRESVEQALTSFPLHNYFTSVDIAQLR